MDAQDQTQSQAPAPTTEAAPPQASPVQEAAPSPDLAALQARIAQYEAQLQEKEQSWNQERELLRSGVLDAEAQEVARFFYGKVQPDSEGKKPSLSGWLSQRDQLPKAVQAYLPQPQAQAQAAPTVHAPPSVQTQAPAPVRLPDSDRGAGAAPQASSAFSPTAIKSLSKEEYAASRAAILASLGKR